MMHSIAEMMMEAMTQVSWSGKGLDELERAVQPVMGPVANRVLQEVL